MAPTNLPGARRCLDCGASSWLIVSLLSDSREQVICGGCGARGGSAPQPHCDPRRTAPGPQIPFGPVLRVEVEAGSESALHRALAATAATWIAQGGADWRFWQSLTPSLGCRMSPQQAAVFHAGLELMQLLALSPQGRKAIADLCGVDDGSGRDDGRPR